MSTKDWIRMARYDFKAIKLKEITISLDADYLYNNPEKTIMELEILERQLEPFLQSQNKDD